MSKRFRILKDTLRYSGSALLAQALGLVVGLCVARWLAPRDLGVWNFVSLVLVYGAYVDFGMLSAMGRDLPFRLGQGDPGGAAQLEAAARIATIVGAGVAAVVVLIASVVWFSGAPATQLGLRLMAVGLLLQQMYTYHRTVLRAHNQFSELSRQQVWLALITAACTLVGVWLAGLRGRMFGAVAAQAVILWYALVRHPWRRLPTFDRANLWSLMRVGVPITVSGFVLALVTSVDRLMVKAFLGDTQLGYFGLALLLTSVVSLVPSMAGQVLYPRITYHFGASGGDVAALRRFVLTPPLVLARVLPFVIGPTCIIVPLVIRVWLPAYVPGIDATRIVIVGIFFFSVLGLCDYFLVTIGKLAQYVMLGCATLLLNIGLDYAALRLGYGIEGVAFAGTPLTYFAYSSALIGYALSHYTRDPREWCRYFGRLWFPCVYMVVLLWALDAMVRVWTPVTRVGIVMAASAEVGLYLVAVAPLGWLAARELRVDWSWDMLARLRAGR